MNIKIYYQNRDFAHFGMREFEVEAGRKQKLKVSDLPNTHVFLREIEVEHKDKIYHDMQVERWPREELEKDLPNGVVHTSMNAGDVYQDEDGNYFECLLEGWRKME